MSDEAKRRLQRRDFLKAGAAAGMAAITPSAAAHPKRKRGGHHGEESEDLVLVNGKIHTLDQHNSVASSVTISNGRFVNVGHGHWGRGHERARHRPEGRTVVPGLIEGHVHIVSLANRPGYHTPIESDDHHRARCRRCSPRAGRGVPAGQWITAMGGWHPFQWTDVRRRPTLAELDAAVSDRPVFLFGAFTGPAVVNTLGKAVPREHRRRRCRPGAPSRDDGTHRGRLRRRRPGDHGALPPARACRPSRTRSAARSTRWPSRPSVGLTAHLDQMLFPTPGPLTPHAGPVATSTTTACTTRGSRCTARARPSSGCR